MHSQISAIYQYYDSFGRKAFQRVRIEKTIVDNGEVIARDKVILWRHSHSPVVFPDGCNWADPRGEHWHWESPGTWARHLIYTPKPDFSWLNGAGGRTLYLPEGEKDCDSLARIGAWSATHPSGAEVGPSRINARRVVDLFKGKGMDRISIIMDRDEAGAFNAWRWYELLTAQGVPAALVGIVRACGPLEQIKDVTDHLNAGNKPSDLIGIGVDEVHGWASAKIEARRRADLKRQRYLRSLSPAERERLEIFGQHRSRGWYRPGRKVGA